MNKTSQARKLQILSYLEMNEEQDVGQIAEEFQMTFEAAGMLLLRLFRQGLLKRELDAQDHMFFYSITPKGRGRLNYFRNCTDSLGGHHAKKS
jgi:DNA-binding MarR family transcriptional regulator